MEALSDLALVTQATLLGNKRAFDQLVRKHQSAVRRFLLSLTLGNEPLSDDLAKETFIKAYTHLSQFRALASFQTWLFRIAYRVFYDYRREQERKGLREQAGHLLTAVTDTAASTPDASLRMDLYRALALLKDEERTCITLQLIDGEPVERIARITGMGPNTVKSHLRRGKEKLANYLRQNGYDR